MILERDFFGIRQRQKRRDICGLPESQGGRDAKKYDKIKSIHFETGQCPEASAGGLFIAISCRR
jgi:hypothetical protein